MDREPGLSLSFSQTQEFPSSASERDGGRARRSSHSKDKKKSEKQRKTKQKQNKKRKLQKKKSAAHKAKKKSKKRKVKRRHKARSGASSRSSSSATASDPIGSSSSAAECTTSMSDSSQSTSDSAADRRRRKRQRKRSKKPSTKRKKSSKKTKRHQKVPAREALLAAIRAGDWLQVIASLRRKGALAATPTTAPLSHSSETPQARSASESSSDDEEEELIEFVEEYANAPTENATTRGLHALHEAVLLARGGDDIPHQQSEKDLITIRSRICTALLQHGADINCVDNRGWCIAAVPVYEWACNTCSI